MLRGIAAGIQLWPERWLSPQASSTYGSPLESLGSLAEIGLEYSRVGHGILPQRIDFP